MRYNPFVTCYVLRATDTGHEVLQLFRRKGAYMGETWQAVSGAIEQDESAWQAALRELTEETSLRPLHFFRLLSTYTFYVPQNDTLNFSICFCVIVEKDAAVILNEEHTDFRWIPLQDAMVSFMWPSDHSALDEIKKYVLGDGLCSPYLPIPPPHA